MKLTPESLPAHLQKHLLRAYLISGDEPLLVGEAADAIRARARASGFGDREVHFVTGGFSWPDLTASVNTLSLFASQRLVEIRLPSARPGVTGAATLLGLIEAKLDDVVLLVTAPRLERETLSAPWVRAIEKHGAWIPVWPVDVARLPGWLASRARALGLQAEPGALDALADRIEGNLLAAHQELEKLRLASTDGRLTLDQVAGAVADSARFDTFKLLDAALEGDAARALRILDGLRAEGFEPVLVLWALARAARDLWATLAESPEARQGWSRRAAALERGRARAGRLDYLRLASRAERADRIIKGRESGDAWDEMALLAADLCGAPVLAGGRA